MSELGTYHLRVELVDGRGWIEEWSTGARYERGSGRVSPLDAWRIPPGWDNEVEIFEAMEFMSMEGNNSCDCNKALSLARAYQQEIPEDLPCGDTMKIKRLTAIRPDGSEQVLVDESS